MDRRKYKTATFMPLIASSIMIFLSIATMIGVLSESVFPKMYYGLIEQMNIIYGDIEAIFTELEGDATTLRVLIFTMFLVFSILGLILSVPATIFSILCLKDYSLEVESFQKRNKLHVFQFISIILLIVASNINVSSYLFGSFVSLLSLAITIISIISLVNVIREMTINRRLANNQENESEVNNRYQSYQEQTFEETEPENKETVIEKEKPQVKEVDKGKLEETYELLAKLEKSHRNGELSDEDYERMKKTILDSFVNGK